jgi:hypothetical protein
VLTGVYPKQTSLESDQKKSQTRVIMMEYGKERALPARLSGGSGEVDVIKIEKEHFK